MREGSSSGLAALRGLCSPTHALPGVGASVALLAIAQFAEHLASAGDALAAKVCVVVFRYSLFIILHVRIRNLGPSFRAAAPAVGRGAIPAATFKGQKRCAIADTCGGPHGGIGRRSGTCAAFRSIHSGAAASHCWEASHRAPTSATHTHQAWAGTRQSCVTVTPL